MQCVGRGRGGDHCGLVGAVEVLCDLGGAVAGEGGVGDAGVPAGRPLC